MVYQFDSAIGSLAVEVRSGKVLRLWLPCEVPSVEADEGPCGIAAEAIAQVQAYLTGRLREFDLPLGPLPGTELQQKILRAIATVPYGQTAAYGSLGPARVVGHVCATNPLPLIIPCHRIVPAHGAPGNYRGGPELKRRLLEMEHRHFSLRAWYHLSCPPI